MSNAYAAMMMLMRERASPDPTEAERNQTINDARCYARALIDWANMDEAAIRKIRMKDAK